MWAAARELGVAAEACLVVGDSLKADIAGARAAGMRSAWVNRSREAQPAEPRPDWTVATLDEVVELVCTGRGRRGQ
jgi:FMN phosphatase YigB (HAD superfamily)